VENIHKRLAKGYPSLVCPRNDQPFYDLGEEALWIYAHWITCIREAPKLPGLTGIRQPLKMKSEEIVQVIIDLREWVQNHKCNELGKLGGVLLPYLDVKGQDIDFLMPTKILERVGYDPGTFKGRQPDRQGGTK